MNDIKRVEKMKSKTTDPEENPGPKEFILVVDDVSQNLQVLCTILGKKNYKIAIARSGKKTLEMVEKVLPDLILLDVTMPEMDGFEVCRRLHHSPRTRDIPVIFLTARIETESVVKAFEMGAVDYVTKPFNSAELLARVNTHLELKRTREELVRRNKELIKTQKDLEISALTDPLTKLLNRRAILTNIQYEKNRFERKRKPFTLLLGDIDGFKGFNDKYGHECGDFVLVSTVQIMKSLVRKVDSVARWGGEEFLLLLPDTGLEGGRTIAEKIRQTIADHTLTYNQTPLAVTMTLGVSTYAYSCSQDIDDCIRSVDLVMYEGKKKGKNCVVTAQRI